MPRRAEILVKPMPAEMTIATLRSFFSQFGPVIDATIARDKDTGRPTVFGFVLFENRDDACGAIREVDGKQLEEGRTINVTWAISSKPPGRELVFRELPADATSNTLRNICAPLGSVTCVDLVMDQFTGDFNRYAYVQFANDDDAVRVADELDGAKLGDGVIRVNSVQDSLLPGFDVFVRFLPLDIRSKALRRLFAQYGRVIDVDLMHKLYVGERTTRAFVRFEREADAAKSIDELDGFVMNGTPIRIRWAKAYAPKGVRVRLSELDVDVDRRLLRRLFERFDGIKSIEIEYNLTTAESLGFGHITFGSSEQAESAVVTFGGRLSPHGWTINLPKAVIERELERMAPVEASFTRAPCPAMVPSDLPPTFTNSKKSASAAADDAPKAASDISTNVSTRISLADLTHSSTSHLPENTVVASTISSLSSKWQRFSNIEGPSSVTADDDVSVRRVRAKFIRDLLTDGWIYIPAGTPEADHSLAAASKDLISFVDPLPAPTLPHAVDDDSQEPVVIGSRQSTKSGRSILVQCYAVSEASKHDKVIDILTTDASEWTDPNKNVTDARILKTTLVVSGLTEMRMYVDRLTKAGIDCFMCADKSVRGGHSWHPLQGISVHVAEPPLSDNVRYSQHVVFLRPSSDVAVTLDLLRTLKSTVSMVSVLSDEHSPLESTQMALLEGTLLDGDE